MSTWTNPASPHVVAHHEAGQGIRWRQRHRTLLGSGSAVEISYNYRRERGIAGSASRGTIAICAGCLCCDHIGRESVGL
jgi:hypothetical protein